MVGELAAAATASQLDAEQLKAAMEVARSKEGVAKADTAAQKTTRGGCAGRRK
jgi:hypothetical protein